MAATDVILVNYNGADDTIMCIESLWQMASQDFRIIIVENGSSDNSLETLQQFTQAHDGQSLKYDELALASESLLVLIIADDNRGFAAGNNLGIKLSVQTSEVNYIWLLNNDTVVDKNAMKALVVAHETYKASTEQNPGILGSRVKFYHDKNIIQAVGGIFEPSTGKVKLIGFNETDSEVYQQPSTYDMVLGASMFVDVEFVEKAGALNEAYFLYFEELDWSQRAKKHGFLTRYIPESIVYHKQGQATGNNVLGKKSEFAMYHMYKSLLIFYRTYYPQYLSRIRVRIFIRLIKFQLKGQLNAWPVFKKIFLAS